MSITSLSNLSEMGIYGVKNSDATIIYSNKLNHVSHETDIEQLRVCFMSVSQIRSSLFVQYSLSL